MGQVSGIRFRPSFRWELSLGVALLLLVGACQRADPTEEVQQMPLERGYAAPWSRLGLASGHLPSAPSDQQLLPGLFATEDAGLTWRDVTPPQLDVMWESVLTLDFVTPSDGFVVTFNPALGSELWVSTDGGKEWAYAFDVGGTFHHAGDAATIDFVDATDGFLYMFSAAGTGCGSVAASHDGGQSWTFGVNECLPQPGEIRFDDASTGWLGGQAHGMNSQPGDLFRTTDGGVTWDAIRLAVPQELDFALARVDLPTFFGDQGLVAVTMLDGPVVVFSSSDHGASWIFETIIDTGALSKPNPRPSEVSFANADTWWIATSFDTETETLLSTDRGKTWHLRPRGPGGILHDLVATNESTAWLTTDQGLFATYDGGRSWEHLISG